MQEHTYCNVNWEHLSLLGVLVVVHELQEMRNISFQAYFIGDGNGISQ